MENTDFIFPAGFLDPGIQDWKNECRSRHQEWFDLAHEANRLAIKILLSANVNNLVLHEMLLATLYVRALHTYQGAVLMTEHGMMTQGKMLARCLIEAIFPLVAISKNNAFANDYVDAHVIHQIKSHEKFQRLSTVDVPEINSQKTIDRVNELKAEKDDKGLRKISTEEWSKRAELHDWYLTAYASLSGSVHSSIGDLQEYLVMGEDDKVEELLWWPQDKGIHVLLLTAIEGLVLAMENIKLISKIDISADLETLEKAKSFFVSRDLLNSDEL